VSKQLTEFLTNLATDPALKEAFTQDKVATMQAHGVSDDHIQLVVNKQYDEIQSILGSNYTIATNSIIHATKK
jgi:hypothetical protein